MLEKKHDPLCLATPTFWRWGEVHTHPQMSLSYALGLYVPISKPGYQLDIQAGKFHGLH